MERSVDGRHLYQRVAMQPAPSDSKNSIADDYEAYKQYYSTERLPFYYAVNLGRFRLLLAAVVVFTLVLLIFNKTRPGDVPDSVVTPHTPMKSLGGEFNCDPDVMKPSATVPVDVNKVRPADIKVIAAMGDSIMVGAWATNFLDDKSVFFPGNSFAIGGDETVHKHITLANILREFNSAIVGASRGEGLYNTELNVAVSGRTSLDLPRQALDLIDRIRNRLDKGRLLNDWKLITIFIGTNDIGKLRCIEKETTPSEKYKEKIEEALSTLRKNLNRTIISVVSIWNSQLTYDAASLIENGTRMECGDTIKKRDALTEEYRKALYEIQNEKKFDEQDFTVVVQGFMDDIRDAFRNKKGDYDKSFYAADMFHLSKYGNAVLGKFLWNTMLEPVGKKTTKADLGDDSAPLKCPSQESPFIQTLRNKS